MLRRYVIFILEGLLFQVAGGGDLMPMKTTYDAIMIGAGPAAGHKAELLALQGLAVAWVS